MKLRKTTLALIFIVVAIGAGIFLCFKKTEQTRLDRIILITLDTLRADHLGCFGYPRETSPFLDSLAEEAVFFTRVLAPMPSTVPSHAALFTSRYPIQLGVLKNGHRLRDSFLTVAEFLKGLGYRTAAFVSVNHLFGKGNLDKGFDIFNEPELPEDVLYRPAAEMVDWVCDWVQERYRDEKFFLWIHFFDTHSPYDPPVRFLELFSREPDDMQNRLCRFLIKKYKVDPDFFSGLPEKGFEEGSGIHLADYQMRTGTERLLEIINAYDGEVRFMDTELRRLYRCFENKKLNENSLWIITADHGEGLGNHGWLEHEMNLYNEQIRVPLLFIFPSGPYRGQSIDQVAELVDILPTIGELIGVKLTPVIKGTQGVSLVPLFSNVGRMFHNIFPLKRYPFAQRRHYDGPDPDDVISDKKDYEGEVYSIEDKDYKYIYRTEGKDELYDLSHDPYETKNLIGTAHPEEQRLKKEILRRVKRFKAEVNEQPESVDKKGMEELKTLGYIR